MCQFGVDTLLAIVVIVLNVVLSAVEKVETPRNNDSDDANGTIKQRQLTEGISRDIDASSFLDAYIGTPMNPSDFGVGKSGPPCEA